VDGQSARRCVVRPAGGGASGRGRWPVRAAKAHWLSGSTGRLAGTVMGASAGLSGGCTRLVSFAVIQDEPRMVF